MSGLEALGAVASVVQLFDYGIRTSQTVLRLYNTVKSSTQKTEGRLQIVRELQRLLTELRSEKELHTASLEILIRPMINRLLQLEKILQKLQNETGKIGTYFSPLVNEERIREILTELEQDKSSFLMHFAVLSVRSQQGIQTKLSKMPTLVGASSPEISDTEQAKVVMSNLPSTHVSRFIGQRLQLSFINAEFEASNKVERILVITGTAGAGKSQLAINFARARQRMGTSIHWIDCSSNEQLRRSFWNIASDIYMKKLHKHPCASPEHAIDYVRGFLTASKTHWVVIFDNWDQPEFLPDLLCLLPTSHSGFVLVTSRHPDVARLGISIELDGMTEDDALELLFARIGFDSQQDPRSAGLAIVRRLAFLPLAIDQAASYIRSVGVPVQQFLHHYEDRKQQVLKHVPTVWEYRRPIKGKEDLEISGVFTTWELSFVSFAAKHASAAEFMDVLGFFDRSSIDEALFKNFVNFHERDVGMLASMPAAKAMYDVLGQFRAAEGCWNSDAFADVLKQLKNERLVEGSSLSSMGTLRISLHPLVSDWLKIRRDKQTSSKLFAQTGSIVQCVVDAKETESDYSLELWQELLAHADQLLLHWRTLTTPPGDEIHAAMLACCKLYFRRGRYASAVETYHKLLTSLDSVGQQDSLQKYEALRGLARSYHTAGKYREAEKAVRESIEGFRKRTGEDSLQTAASKQRLADLLRSRADLDSAEKIYLEVIACRKSVLGEMAKKTLVSTANLALVYKAQKKYDEAQAIYDKLAAILWSDGKEIEFSLIWIKNDYATLLQNQGRFEEAQTIYEEILASRQTYLGSDHHDTLWTLADLATNLKSQQKYAEAKVIYEETVSRLKHQLGETHSETLWAASGLGDLYARMGDLLQAEDLLIWVLRCRRQLLGDDHPNTLQTLDHLANVYSLQSQLEEISTSTEEATLPKANDSTVPEHREKEDTSQRVATATATRASGFMNSLALIFCCGRLEGFFSRENIGR